MGSFVSQFINKITRTKSEDDDDDTEIDFLKLSRNLWLPKSVELLLSACFNCALFAVVGLAVKSIAGPAMVLSLILGAVIAVLNNLSLTELCTRFPTSTSFYSIVYKNVGELCAFTVGWFRLLQNIFMISLVTITAGEYIYSLAQPPPDTSWLPPHSSWHEIHLDSLVFMVVFLALLSLMVAAGLPHFSVYLKALFWTNLLAFIFMLLVIIYYANSLNWYVPTEFQPFDFAGTIQGTAITTFFFTNLDKVVEQVENMKQPNTMAPISLAISLLCVFLYYLCSTIFVTILVPLDVLSSEATIPKAFGLATFHDSKYVLSAAALLIFCLTIIESYFDAQKLLNLLADDGLFHQKFAKQPNPKKHASALLVLVIAILSICLFLFLPVDGLIQGFCITSLLISIMINCATIVVQYLPATLDGTKETSAFPNWQCTKNLIIRFLLCCGYITHKKVLSKLGVKTAEEPSAETSKLVNWSIISYIPSCIGLALAMFHGLPVIGWKRWIVLTALGLLCITIFLTIRIILIQPRAKACFFRNNFLAPFIPLVNIGIFIILVASMDWTAFSAVGIWLVFGLIIYFLFGISHSTEALFNKSEELNEKSKGRVQFDSAPQLSTKLTNVQPENTDADSEQYLSQEDETNPFYYPQKY